VILSPNLAHRRGSQLVLSWLVACKEENVFLYFSDLSVPKPVALVFLLPFPLGAMLSVTKYRILEQACYL